VTVRNLKGEDAQLVLQGKAKLKIQTNIPMAAEPAEATAEIVWSKKDEKDPSGKVYQIGLSYLDIDPQDRSRIFNYARRLKWMPRLISIAIILLLAILAAVSLYHVKVKRENVALVQELVATLEVKNNISGQLGELRDSKRDLEKKFAAGKKDIEGIQSQIASVESRTGAETDRLRKQLGKALAEQKALETQIAKFSVERAMASRMARRGRESQLDGLKAKIDALGMEMGEVVNRSRVSVDALKVETAKFQKENAALKEKLDLVKQGELSLEQQLASIKTKSGMLEEASADRMLEWIKVHQSKATGLVMSYEGDKALDNWGFTYDQALACQAFLISGDHRRARAVLNFYKDKAKAQKGLFYNAYDVKTGSPTEYMIHSGPNIWLAISACQYVRHAGDDKYLGLAEMIADSMIRSQSSSRDKGIKGGPGSEWVSTEHNLDGYALFNLLYELTNKDKYRAAASTALAWLRDIGYNKPEGRFMRGRGDATIATDTFSWAIAAIGPKTLSENGMNPDGIMEFAENECKVTANFYRPDNSHVKVVGFDFAKARNLGRGGIVSCEWTAQMIVAFEIMADYYKEAGDKQKAGIYRAKAEYYLSQLGRMVIASPSPTGQGEGCLPYASMDDVDTGHGWRAPKGRRTGSVAATAYYIFAFKRYNPLKG